MIQTKKRQNCHWWFSPSLAVLLCSLNTYAQGPIVYVHLPPTEPELFPYDAEGLRLWGGSPMSYDLVFNGQVAFTLISRYNFSITPSSSNAVLALHPGLYDLGGFVIPLLDGQQIGPDA